MFIKIKIKGYGARGLPPDSTRLREASRISTLVGGSAVLLENRDVAPTGKDQFWLGLWSGWSWEHHGNTCRQWGKTWTSRNIIGEKRWNILENKQFGTSIRTSFVGSSDWFLQTSLTENIFLYITPVIQWLFGPFPHAKWAGHSRAQFTMCPFLIGCWGVP